MYTDDVSIILPSLNPDEKLLGVVQGLRERGFSDIIIIDDGSDAEYRANFPDPALWSGCTLLRHDVNRGKGAALRTGFAYFAEHRAGRIGVVTADGDAQHSTADICACAQALCETPDTLILGARDFSLPQVPPRSRKGNRITSFVFRTGVGMRITDTQTGLRGIPASSMDVMLGVKGDRYEYETNMLLALKRYNIPYREISIETVYIDENKTTHFRVIRDSVRVYGTILRYAASSLGCTLIDLGVFWLLSQLFDEPLGDWSIPLFTVAARVVSSTVNYMLNRRVVFRHTANAGSSAARYYSLAAVQMSLSAAIVWLLSWALGTRVPVLKTVIKALVDTALFFASFVIQREWVFRTHKNKTEK